MLVKRLITAVAGILVAVMAVNYGDWLFSGITLILALCAWHEYYRMMQNKNINIWYPGGFLLLFLLMSCAWLGNTAEIIFVVVLTIVLLLTKTIFYGKAFNLTDAIYTCFGLNYIGLCFMHLLLLRNFGTSASIMTTLGPFPCGAAYVWLVFVGTWSSDTFAYFVGSIIGKHKICPAISPGKTLEGMLGGLGGSVIFVTLLGWLFKVSLFHTVIIGLLIGIAATLGDLAESLLKRFCGVKDSGELLPGHGGVLDRFDSVLFVAPAVYYYVYNFL